MNKTKFIRTDECDDVLGSLEHCALSLQQVRQSGRAWKWVVLSLHSALQGAMVCHLSGSTQLGALQKESAAKWLEWYEKYQQGETQKEPPREFVANAHDLFIRLGCPSSRIETGCGEIIEITSRQKTSFKRLHDLRNNFSHFSPKGWSIELDFIKEIIEDILDVMCSIQDDHWPFRHMSEENRKALRLKIEEIRTILHLEFT